MGYYFKAEKISVGYHGKPLIENLDIVLEKGEILTLIGPNGAGKSTILKSIARQLALLGGVIYLDGSNQKELSGQELSMKMAVVLTERIKMEMVTCQEVVATGRYPYTGHFGILTGKDREAVREAMDLVQVTEIRNQDFSRISDGQRQRVMLARALCQEPEIIILDEPTSFLDVKYKLEFLSVLQKMKRKKELTVILSLHELELAEKVSDKILCVKGSSAERFGTVSEIFQKGYISQLFSVTSGTIDEENTNMELEPVKGDPEIFVIAGGGCGRKVYRDLQRKGIPFVTGILYENDLDYPVAKALAADVISSNGFEPVTDREMEKAGEWIKKCKKIICCKEHFGTYEKMNEELLRDMGDKVISYEKWTNTYGKIW